MATPWSRSTLTGRAAHSSQPDLGVNAVAHLGRLLVAVEQRDAELGEGGASLMATVASGGDSPFVLARSARVLVERRTVPGERSDAALAEVEQLLADLRATDPPSTATARLVIAREPWRLDAHGPAASLSAALEAALGRRATEHACAATLPRALLDGGAAVASGRHPGPGLRTRRGWAARGRRVGRPRPGAAVCRRPHRRRSRAGRPSMPTDPRRLRGDAPLLDAWLRFQEQAPTPFTIPGHKQRRDLVGDVVAGDVPLYAGLDTMKLARGVVADAETRAARLWGADLCRFSVGGSTHGNQALALAVARPGDRVVVARTLHRSMLLGLVLAGLEPVWLRPEVDATPRAPDRRHRRRPRGRPRRAPDARAVFVGDPSYVGTVGDVGGLATVAHRHGIPLVVDAAWGAHLGFHPALPPHALAAGADALVTSAHKALPAWSQGALVLARSRRIGRARFDAAVEATATTSPSGAILASIDAARALLERDGEALLGPVIEAVATRARAARPGARAGRARRPRGRPDAADPGAPRHGRRRQRGRGRPARPRDAGRDGRPRHRRRDGDPRRHRRGPGRPRRRPRRVGRPAPGPPRDRSSPPGSGRSTRSPSPARGRPSSPRARACAVEQAVGRVSAELVAPYPPGIPVLAPGEEVTLDAVDALRAARAAGSRIAYAADPTVHTLDVIAE